MIAGFLFLASPVFLSSQSNDGPPSDLIGRLTGASRQGVRSGVFACGQETADYQQNRELADALVRKGTEALRDIETALGAIENHGQESKFAANANWLLVAYARIKGPAAFPRLRAMADNPHFEFLRFALDYSAAISLDLTSFVSSSEVLGIPMLCELVQEPRDTLNQFVAAWEKGVRHYLEASLGPEAKAALQSLMGNRTWANMRARIWPGSASQNVAVGYKFETPGWWSEREPQFQVDLATRIPADPDINTRFTNEAGISCGSMILRFSRSNGFPVAYHVDNVDIEHLLRLISSCAEK